MRHALDDGTLRGYLALVGYASRVFPERVAAGTLAEAEAVLRPGGRGLDDRDPTVIRALATQQAFAAWLNFARGGVRWDQAVPNGQPFGAAMARVEAILLDPDATRDDYLTAYRLAQAITVMNVGGAACR